MSRVWRTRRWAIDVDVDDVGLLDIQVGVYRCEPYGRYFRNELPFIRPSATYTHRVVRIAISSVFEDGMPVSRVPRRMARDFWVQPSEASIRLWCHQWAQQERESFDYEAWAVQRFSGTLCVDELYQGRLAVLLAADPRAPEGDRLVAYQLQDGAIDKRDTERFLRRLKTMGIDPDQVVTDGSPLYPEVLSRVWPKAAHQLCLFHVTRQVTQAVTAVTRQVLAALPEVPNCPKPAARIRRSHSPDSPSTFDRRARISYVLNLCQQGKSMRAIAHITGHSKNSVKAWLRGQVGLPDDLGEDEIDNSAPLSREDDDCLLPSAPKGWTSWEEVRRFKAD